MRCIYTRCLRGNRWTNRSCRTRHSINELTALVLIDLWSDAWILNSYSWPVLGSLRFCDEFGLVDFCLFYEPKPLNLTMELLWRTMHDDADGRWFLHVVRWGDKISIWLRECGAKICLKIWNASLSAGSKKKWDEETTCSPKYLQSIC